jgi:N-acetyl-anhydromuramyl-L-alanine amidase AmpD
MSIAFIGAASANFRAGRPAGFVPEAIVLHRTGGTRDAIRGRFNDPRSSVSAHYVVGRDGRVEQYVLERDVAFHAGVIVGPTWPRLRPQVNPNHYTIGVELEGDVADGFADPQIAAAAALIADIARRWQFPVSAERVVTHTAIRTSTRCPGEGFPLDQLLALAADHTAPLEQPAQRVVRTLSAARLRRGAPSLAAPIARVVPADTVLAVAGFTATGDRVDGNACWYALVDDEFVWAGATDVPAPVGDGELSPAEADTTDAMEPAAAPDAAPPSGSLGVAIDRSTMVLAAKEFVGTVTAKDLIVLHFTAGTTARSAFDTWRLKPERVATSYIVDVDGTIFEVFPPRFWAAHLGVKGTKNADDRRSIGIEIANVGPLQPSTSDPGTLNWWPKRSASAGDFTTPFCRVDETDRYVRANYRGKAQFAAFPDTQVDAVAGLVRGLCQQFAIAPTLPAAGRRFDADPGAFASYKGVCSHANFRQDKWDIGPAFPWDRLGL